MKNQYVGDIRDYGKYALLRALAAQYSIGLNWYLTPDDGRPDGKLTNYLKLSADPLDEELFQWLKKLLYSENGNLCHEGRIFAHRTESKYFSVGRLSVPNDDSR